VPSLLHIVRKTTYFNAADCDHLDGLILLYDMSAVSHVPENTLAAYINTILAPLPAKSTPFDSSKWRRRVADQSCINSDHSYFKRLGDSMAPRNVLAEEISRQANISLIRHLDNLLLSLEREDTGNRSKCLFGHNLHARLHAGDYRGLEEVAPELRNALSANDDSRTVSFRVLDVLYDLLDGTVVDQWTVRDALIVATADLEVADFLCERFSELVIYARLDEQSVGAHAGLARAAELACYSASDGRIEVCVIEHYERSITAELETELLESGGALRHEQLADTSAAGEGDFLDGIGGGDCFANFGCILEGRDKIYDAGGNAGTVCKLGKGCRGERSLARRLCNNGAAGR